MRKYRDETGPMPRSERQTMDELYEKTNMMMLRGWVVFGNRQIDDLCTWNQTAGHNEQEDVVLFSIKEAFLDRSQLN